LSERERGGPAGKAFKDCMGRERAKSKTSGTMEKEGGEAQAPSGGEARNDGLGK